VFVLLLTYVKPLAEVDALMREHVAWLDEQYDAGRFLVSGRQIPRRGGVILARGDDREEIERLAATDPFVSAVWRRATSFTSRVADRGRPRRPALSAISRGWAPRRFMSSQNRARWRVRVRRLHRLDQGREWQRRVERLHRDDLAQRPRHRRAPEGTHGTTTSQSGAGSHVLLST